MPKYRFTFGQKYWQEPHPVFPMITPDDWLMIEAATVNDATGIAHEHIGDRWSFVYSEPQWEESRKSFTGREYTLDDKPTQTGLVVSGMIHTRWLVYDPEDGTTVVFRFEEPAIEYAQSLLDANRGFFDEHQRIELAIAEIKHVSQTHQYDIPDETTPYRWYETFDLTTVDETLENSEDDE